jgi:hypothetical protein
MAYWIMMLSSEDLALDYMHKSRSHIPRCMIRGTSKSRIYNFDGSINDRRPLSSADYCPIVRRKCAKWCSTMPGADRRMAAIPAFRGAPTLTEVVCMGIDNDNQSVKRVLLTRTRDEQYLVDRRNSVEAFSGCMRIRDEDSPMSTAPSCTSNNEIVGVVILNNHASFW